MSQLPFLFARPGPITAAAFFFFIVSCGDDATAARSAAVCERATTFDDGVCAEVDEENPPQAPTPSCEGARALDEAELDDIEACFADVDALDDDIAAAPAGADRDALCSERSNAEVGCRLLFTSAATST